MAYNSAMPPRRLGCVAQRDHLPRVLSDTIAPGYIKSARGDVQFLTLRAFVGG